MEKVESYLFVSDQPQFLLHICILVLAMFHLLQEKNLIFCGISTVVFLVNNSGGGFLLKMSGSARFFLAC